MLLIYINNCILVTKHFHDPFIYSKKNSAMFTNHVASKLKVYQPHSVPYRHPSPVILNKVLDNFLADSIQRPFHPYQLLPAMLPQGPTPQEYLTPCESTLATPAGYWDVGDENTTRIVYAQHRID